MRRHLETLKQKPQHVRHKVAFGTAAGITGLVALIWAVSTAATGNFALTSPGESSEPRESSEEFSGLLGAVGASLGATSSDPALSIVDGDTTSTFDEPVHNPDATVIPF